MITWELYLLLPHRTAGEGQAGRDHKGWRTIRERKERKGGTREYKHEWIRQG